MYVTIDLMTCVGKQVAFDEEFDKQFLLCDYNRDGDSYRLDLPSLSA